MQRAFEIHPMSIIFNISCICVVLQIHRYSIYSLDKLGSFCVLQFFIIYKIS